MPYDNIFISDPEKKKKRESLFSNISPLNEKTSFDPQMLMRDPEKPLPAQPASDAGRTIDNLRADNALITDPEKQAKRVIIGNDGKLYRTDSLNYQPENTPVPKGFTTEGIRGTQRTLYEYDKNGRAVMAANNPYEKENIMKRNQDIIDAAMGSQPDTSTEKQWDKRGRLIRESSSNKSNIAGGLNAAANIIQPDIAAESAQNVARTNLVGDKYRADASFRTQKYESDSASARSKYAVDNDEKKTGKTAGDLAYENWSKNALGATPEDHIAARRKFAILDAAPPPGNDRNQFYTDKSKPAVASRPVDRTSLSWDAKGNLVGGPQQERPRGIIPTTPEWMKRFNKKKQDERGGKY